MNKSSKWILWLFFLIDLNVMASPTEVPWYHNIQGTVALGANWLNAHDETIIISDFETDSLKMHNIHNNLAWKAGIGYSLFDNYLAQNTYLNHLLFEINVYQIFGNISGDVWQYQQIEFNNYAYQSHLNSTRLMFDFKPFIGSYKWLSPYLILGIGSAWNKLSYYEHITGTDVPNNSNLTLGNATTAQLAGDLGAGIHIPINQHLSISGEYIYAFLGHAQPSNLSSNGAVLQSRPQFSLQTQSLLFGLNIKI